MKGIIGIVGGIKSNELERMSRCLSHRGQATLKTNDVFSIGQLSTCWGATLFYQDGISVISDARIDNQAEILEKIGLAATLKMSENELIFRAYSKLSINFVDCLAGDYSIFIVDEIRQKVFLIRDHLGVRPLYYSFRKGEFMAFASEPKALLLLDDVSSEPNEEKLEEYLQWPTDHRIYPKTTFFKDIFAVLPATVLEIDMDLHQSKETFYWKIDPEQFSHLNTESLLIEEYRKRFERAVSRRLQSLTGVQVSGGLDSSSVYKVAERYLPTENLFSVHFYPKVEEADEREYTLEVVQNNLPNHHQIERSVVSRVSIEQVQMHIDRPDLSTIPMCAKILPELIEFKRKGVATILTGHEGDTVVDTGLFYLFSLIFNLKFKAFEETIGGDRKTTRVRRVYLVKRAFHKKYAEGGLSAVVQLLVAVVHHQTVSFVDLMRIMTSFGLGVIKKMIFRKKTKAPAQLTNYVPETLTGDMREHFSRICCAGIIDANEILNLAGAAFGIEYAHPFLDKDFIELSLMVPGRMRISPQAMTRYHFRQAMTGILPEKVRLRQSKVLFAKPIWLILADMTNACMEENDLDAVTKEKLALIKKGLQNMNHQNFDFDKIRKFQRQLFLQMWKNQLQSH
ncbi:hypothetical protein DR864_25810 [Runella rosea]|uniref:asparagine synthase (glutamine-hydrolyzing) n=1 Tax=Runella rosea TaxID=2259595 RepID=A0A344TQJ1_9BACT|nr:asparagine synthase-related protein [Runella rosea]AXE20912.1 hypothetical protein DR864_25810 [Runella rosea]